MSGAFDHDKWSDQIKLHALQTAADRLIRDLGGIEEAIEFMRQRWFRKQLEQAAPDHPTMKFAWPDGHGSKAYDFNDPLMVNPYAPGGNNMAGPQ